MANYDLNLFLSIVNSQIGKHEVGDSNSGPDVLPYQRATNLGGTGWPWCAAFVDWCIREYCTKLGNSLTNEEDNWRSKTASAFGELDWGRSHGCQVKNRNQLAKAGDIVVFNFSHTGFVVEDQRHVGDSITTIEGNTSASGSRDGGSVWKKSRSPAVVKGYVTWLPYVPQSDSFVKPNNPPAQTQAPAAVAAPPQAPAAPANTQAAAAPVEPYNAPTDKIRALLEKVIKAKADKNPGYDLNLMLKVLPEFCMMTGILPGPRLDYFLTNMFFETGNLRVNTEEGSLQYLHYLENRPELGNTAPGDGVKYRGRGPLQTTGKENYVNYGNQLGIDLVGHPEWLADTRVGCAVATQYWYNRGLNAWADQKLFTQVVHRIKGSLDDIDARRDLLHELRGIMGE